MRILKLICLLCATMLLSCGCANTGELENQAYALVLGVDRADGGIELTIRIPRIGQSGGGQSGTGAEPYIVVAARGRDCAQALENLQWSVARELNLSQIKLLIASEALAREADFADVLTELARTRHLYTTAALVVCEGNARAFIEGQETLLGTRLSSDITAMLHHLTRHGYIPRATVADMVANTLSGYADPVAILGHPDAAETAGDSTEAASVITPDANRLLSDTKTTSSRHYLGAGLFKDGALAMRLDARETQLLSLLCDRIVDYAFEASGMVWHLSSARKPSRRIAIDDKGARLRADVYLSSEDPMNASVRSELETALADELSGLIHRCQREGLDPFGFAECAAAHFPTVQAFRACHWRETLSAADVTVDIHLQADNP